MFIKWSFFNKYKYRCAFYANAKDSYGFSLCIKMHILELPCQL